jgi:hypothetical protein
VPKIDLGSLGAVLSPGDDNAFADNAVEPAERRIAHESHGTKRGGRRTPGCGP